MIDDALYSSEAGTYRSITRPVGYILANVYFNPIMSSVEEGLIAECQT